MFNLRSNALFSFTVLVALAGAATAARATPQQHIDQRQDKQEQRIEQGVASGQLTAPETRRLGREQAGVVRAEARAEADGKISPGEAASIQRRQDRASRDIYRQKHDAQVRP